MKDGRQMSPIGARELSISIVALLIFFSSFIPNLHISSQLISVLGNLLEDFQFLLPNKLFATELKSAVRLCMASATFSGAI